jgi:Family of unknown function (DUF6496)
MPIQAKSKEGIVSEEMHRFKHHQLHSGKGKKKVSSRAQAIAIALSEARRKGYK